MTNNRQTLRNDATTLHGNAPRTTALLLTIFLQVIKHGCSLMVVRHPTTAHKHVASLNSLGTTLWRRFSLSTSPGRLSCSSERSSTKLNAWSIQMPTSKEFPIHKLGSGWYTRIDPTTKPPVYDDEYDNSYFFRSPTDDWPSPADAKKSTDKGRSEAGRGALKFILAAIFMIVLGR